MCHPTISKVVWDDVKDPKERVAAWNEFRGIEKERQNEKEAKSKAKAVSYTQLTLTTKP